jgi:hypothetical protein
VNAGPHGADANPSAARPATSRQDAAALANDKGREIAEQLAKVKMDARKEAAVLPKAVMYCAAGHLIGDTALIDKGKNLAREVENVARRIAPGQPIFMAEQAPTVNPANYLSENHNQHTTDEIMNQLMPGERVSTCKILAGLAGQPTNSILDTGASTTAVSLDCLMPPLIKYQKLL